MFILILSLLESLSSTNVEDVTVRYAERKYGMIQDEKINLDSWRRFFHRQHILRSKKSLEGKFALPRTNEIKFELLSEKAQALYSFISIDTASQLAHFRMINTFFCKTTITKFDPYIDSWTTDFILYSYLSIIENFTARDLNFAGLECFYLKPRNLQYVNHSKNVIPLVDKQTMFYLYDFAASFYEEFFTSSYNTLWKISSYVTSNHQKCAILDIYNVVKSKIKEKPNILELAPEIGGILTYLYTRMSPFKLKYSKNNGGFNFEVEPLYPSTKDYEGVFLLYLVVVIYEKMETGSFDICLSKIKSIIRRITYLRSLGYKSDGKLEDILLYVSRNFSPVIWMPEDVRLHNAFISYLYICKICLPEYIELMHKRVIDDYKEYPQSEPSHVSDHMMDFYNLSCLLIEN